MKSCVRKCDGEEEDVGLDEKREEGPGMEHLI